MLAADSTSVRSARPTAAQTRAAAELERRKRLAKDESDERLYRYRNEPERYAAEVLHVTWWSKQIEIAHSILNNRRTVVYSGHGTGKTHCMGGVVQWHFDVFDPSITLTTAPNWKSIHDLLWGEIKKQRPMFSAGRLLELSLQGGPMHYAAGHNAESSSGFQGRHEERMLIVIDEGQGVPIYIYDGADAMMSGPDCRLAILGNPIETSGRYYEIREDPNFNAIYMSCLEHPNVIAGLKGLSAPFPGAVSLVWVNEMIDRHCTRTTDPSADAFEFPPASGNWYEPNDIFRPRVLGLFPRQAANSVISDAWVLIAREGAASDPKTDPAIGVDVARFGMDLTTIFGRTAHKLRFRRGFAKQDTMVTVGRVVEAAKDLSRMCGVDPTLIPINVDDTGVGGGVTDRLRELGYKAIGVDFGGSAIESDDYYNRGSEMWFHLANLMKGRQLDLSCLDGQTFRKLQAELVGRKYKIQSDSRLRVESKEDVRKRLQRSPDDADGLILCTAGRKLGKVIISEPIQVHVQSQPVENLPQIVLVNRPGKDRRCGDCCNFTDPPAGEKVGRCAVLRCGVEAKAYACEEYAPEGGSR